MKQPQRCDTILTTSLDKHSHAISKIKPKIRIIQIVAPEIIKTEVENFREIVQKLTGKPTTAQGQRTSTKKGNDNHVSKPMKKMESAGDHVPVSQSSKHRTKTEISEEILYGGQNSNGFLSFLGDADCYINIQDMNEFHLPSFRSSSQMDLFGDLVES